MAAVFALPVFGELGNENDFDDPSRRGGARRATRSTAAPARSRRPASSRSCGWARRWRARGAERIARVAAALRDRGVASRRAPTGPGGDRRLVSKDGRSTYLLATFRQRRPPRRARGPHRGAARRHAVRRRSAAACIAAPQVGDQVSADIARAELIAFPILFLLTLLVFRSAVSALLPLAVGGATILLSFLAIRFVNARQPDVDLRAEPDQRARAGAGDRLLAVHGLALPRGAGGAARTARRRWPRRCAPPGTSVAFSARSRSRPRWPR